MQRPLIQFQMTILGANGNLGINLDRWDLNRNWFTSHGTITPILGLFSSLFKTKSPVAGRTESHDEAVVVPCHV